MKTGYSMILGEYIDAAILSHRDCEPYQIVCPSCREPLFKVARKAGEASIDYLSHYNADKAYNSDCELRISSMKKEEIENTNKVSRDQRLEYFLSVLRDLVSANPMYPQGTAKSQTTLNKSKALAFFRDAHYQFLKANRGSSDLFDQIAVEYIKDIEGVGGTIDTAFALSVQKRIAYDVWQHLFSGKSRQNYDFLFNHAYLTVIARCESAVGTQYDSPEGRRLAGFLSRVISSGKQKGMETLAQMANTPVGPPFAVAGSEYFTKAASEISHEMVGCLLELQYFDVLKRKFRLFAN
ncbi:MAG: hypothetical protein AB7U43_12815 [Desulfobacter sp.]